ncbi:MAG: twin-arginine translocase subunit TatC [Sphingobacteriales bacterium JAD_PAG50586_3]|nr:MAG: twin-arginine translocase subunit TatC [Sphingobacteriales bacterium JAD_PAG50586_3]
MAQEDENTDGLGAEMSFLQHLEVLRWHLIRAAFAILVFAIGAFIYMEYIFDEILLAPKSSDFVTFRMLCRFSREVMGNDAMCMASTDINLINTDISGQFSNHLYVSLVVGIVLAFPYVLWEIWRFIRPALRENEARSASGIIFWCSLLFFTGITFGYFIVSPLAVNFLGNYQITEQIQNLIDFNSYISIVTVTTLLTGLVFELPIISYVLSKLGILTPGFMRKYRRHAVVIILITAAIITPSPDIVSQMLVAVPLYVLYEISIRVSARIERNRAKQAI